MNKPQSKTKKLVIDMYFAAMSALANAPQGVLIHKELMLAIEKNVALDDWAITTYEESGNTRWRSIFAFASVGLVKAKYVEKARSVWTITNEGRTALEGFEPIKFKDEVDRLYAEWKNTQISNANSLQSHLTESDEEDSAASPEIRIGLIISQAQQALAAELIDTIKKCEPIFFENLVVKLLLAMGYGGSHQEAGRAVGRSGDGGIDGIISEDRLGLDAIYLQAKRWEGTVGEGAIRDFKGALDAKSATKGVFLTTSSFTPAAVAAASNSRNYKIVLIDGARLAELMIEHNLGVSTLHTYALKKVDTDFFSEE